MADPGQFHRISKLLDIFQTQTAAVRAGLILCHSLGTQQHFPVLFNVNNVGMVVAHFHRNAVFPPGDHNDKVQRDFRVQELYLAPILRQKGLGCRQAFRGNSFQHLHHTGGIATEGTQGTGGFDTGQAAGIGDSHTTHIFDNIAAAPGGNPLRQAAQHFPRPGRREGQGNGFGTAHGRDQFLRQNFQKIRFRFFVQHSHFLTFSVFCTVYHILTVFSSIRTNSFPFSAIFQFVTIRSQPACLFTASCYNDTQKFPSTLCIHGIDL